MMQESRGMSVSSGLTPIEQLELRIRILESEIPFYSERAAEAMVQGVEDSTFRLETERRLEELTRVRDEFRRLQAERRAAQEGSFAAPPQGSPPATTSQLPTGSPPASYPQGQRTMSRPSGPGHPGQQPTGQQQQQITRKQAAIVAAEQRFRSVTAQDCAFMGSVFLDYSDLTACVCVNKYWRNRIRKTPGWRRVVLNLETTLHGHIGRISALTMFDTLIVTGSNDGKIKFWDPAKGFVCVKTLNITPSPVHKYVHPRLRELRDSQRQTPGYATNEEEEFAEYPLAVTALLTVDRCVLIGAEDGRFIVWMAATQEKKEFDTGIHTKALNCIVLWEDFIFTASLDGRVAAIARRGFPFNPQAPAVWQSPQFGVRRHEAGVTALAVAGGYLFSGAMDGKIFVWQPRGMEFKRVLQHNRGYNSTNGQPVVIEHTDRITSMTSAHDRLYTASYDGTIKLWNARSLECLRDVPVLPIGICWSLAIRRDQLSRMTTLVAGVRDSDICVMDWETLDVLSSCEQNLWAYKLDRHSHWVRCIMAFGVDGRIVSGSDDWSAKVWHVRGSAQRPQSLFLGLPPGALSQEDCEIIMSQMLKRAGQQFTVEQLQEQKLAHDKNWKEKMAHSTADQVQANENYFNKAAEGWMKAREKRRKELGLAPVASNNSATPAVTGGAPESNSTPAAAVTIATPGTTAFPPTPAATLNRAGSPDEAAGSSTINGASAIEPEPPAQEDAKPESNDAENSKTSDTKESAPVENGEAHSTAAAEEPSTEVATEQETSVEPPDDVPKTSDEPASSLANAVEDEKPEADGTAAPAEPVSVTDTSSTGADQQENTGEEATKPDSEKDETKVEGEQAENKEDDDASEGEHSGDSDSKEREVKRRRTAK